MTRMAILEERATTDDDTKRKYWELFLTALPGFLAMMMIAL